MDRPVVGAGQRLIGVGVAIRLALAAGVIAAVVIPLISAQSTISSLRTPRPTPVPTAGVGARKTPAATPRSSRPASYLTSAGLQAGLARVAKRLPGARLALVRLSAGSLIASAGLRDGTFKEFVLGSTGEFVTPGASSGERALPISQIKPGAVTRILTGMRRRFHVPAAKIDYMVLSSPPHVAARWIVFAKAPGHPGFSATLAGDHLTRIPG